MNVVICSAFRNSAAYIDRYFAQMYELERLLFLRGDCLSLVLGYGDSTDDTGTLLFEQTSGGIGARLLDVSHGGPVHGSIVNADRFRQLAYIGNKIFANVPFDDADAVIWLESDLIWEPCVIIELLNHLQWHACVAPMVLDSNGVTWYDTWAFRKGGVQFTKQPPYHPGLNGGMVKLDSVGSCVAINVPEFHRLTVPEDTVIVGVCEQIRALGGSVGLDCTLKVYHP